MMVSVRVAKLMSNKNAPSPLFPSLIIAVMTMVLLVMIPDLAIAQQSSNPGEDSEPTAIERAFQTEVQPLLKMYCQRCHNVDKKTSGIRLDHLNGALEDDQLFLWKDILKQIRNEAMPPLDELQPTESQRQRLVGWIREALEAARNRNAQTNGSARRLTVAQYRNTLRDLLAIEDDLTDVLPPDSVSRDGFANNGQTMLLSPLLIESYFDIAEEALNLSIVDADSIPVVQNFRMDLGDGINPSPYPDKLILGALSRLLENDDFLITELSPTKSYDYSPFAMRTSYRFIEGYEGNATVRGWREYDSIYHSVFACVRGTDGYPKGLPYQTVANGLLLRPAIPSEEIFGESSTYGPYSNFKISLRELPEYGKFRVTVNAARYEDGLLLDTGAAIQSEPTDGAITVEKLTVPQTVQIDKSGVYQVDVYWQNPSPNTVSTDGLDLNKGLIGSWKFDDGLKNHATKTERPDPFEGDANLVDSPFGKALLVDGNSGVIVRASGAPTKTTASPLTVSAWIHPHATVQGSVVSLGADTSQQGWLFDIPDGTGALRFQVTSTESSAKNSVQSRAGVIRVNQWQHVAAVVQPGQNSTQLYINGYEVASGTLQALDFDHLNGMLHIGTEKGKSVFKGAIDEVQLYDRALNRAEIDALLEPGRRFAQQPAPEEPQRLSLKLGDRTFSRILSQNAFMVVRLSSGPLTVAVTHGDEASLNRLVFSPLKDGSRLLHQFAKFEERSPRMGVHVGLRRDCGSTLTQVGLLQTVSSSEMGSYVFEGAIRNFPSPDVEKNNVNYLAGIREISVRSEYTDGRDMPQLLIQSIEFEGPFYENWPPESHRNIFLVNSPSNDTNDYARRIIRSFSTRAFRRPITDEEEAFVYSIWEESFRNTSDFQQSIKDALLVVLTSPQFLFLIEKSNSPEPEDLDSYELASKLSYFLWNTAPDDRLLGLAESDALYESLDIEMERLIKDSRFRQFVSEFTSQWLSLDKLDVLEVDHKRYPRLTRDTRIQLRQEPIHFLQYLIQHNLPLRNLIQSEFIIANEVVAGYYDLGERTESGFEFVRLQHEKNTLGGILSQAAILAGLSDGRESNPVKRGAWLARRIIAEPPDDPPPNVPDLEEIDETLPLRERLKLHRDQPGCAQCHEGIDPWGIPLEEFDAAGRFKTGMVVESKSTLPDGTAIADFEGLKDYLAGERINQVAFSFLKHLASYGNGRTLGYNELVFLEENAIKLRSDGYRMQDMIRFVIKSEMFLKK